MARINFADIPEQKSFKPVPRGNYVLQVANKQERKSGENSKTPGERLMAWELEIADGENEGRKVWDNQICTEKTMWKIKGLVNACGFDTSTFGYDPDTQEFVYDDEDGEEQIFDMDDLVGTTIQAKIGIRDAHRAPNGKEYDESNEIKGYFPYEPSDSDLLK